MRNKANCVIYSSPQAQQIHNKKRFAICENAGDKEKKIKDIGDTGTVRILNHVINCNHESLNEMDFGWGAFIN